MLLLNRFSVGSRAPTSPQLSCVCNFTRSSLRETADILATPLPRGAEIENLFIHFLLHLCVVWSERTDCITSGVQGRTR